MSKAKLIELALKLTKANEDQKKVKPLNLTLIQMTQKLQDEIHGAIKRNKEHDEEHK